ncbi:MAG: DinB family protein [Tepidisphaeraceae bacterium]
MPQGDCLQILFSHDRWATAQLLNACDALTTEQFHQRFDMGLGSLHDTLTHVIGAMRTWTDTLADVELRPRLETDGQRRTPAELRSLLGEVADAFAAELTRRPHGEVVTRRLMSGKTIHLTRAAALMQVLTHGMHHRAQCLNMLKQLGVKPLPPSSVVEWTWVVDK